MIWNFKKQYISYHNIDVNDQYPDYCIFFDSSRNKGGTGTTSDPYGILSHPIIQEGGSWFFLLSSGNFHKLSLSQSYNAGSGMSFHFIGNSHDTKIAFNLSFFKKYTGYTTQVNLYPINLTVNGGVISGAGLVSGTNKITTIYRKCIIKQLPTISGFSSGITNLFENCIFDNMNISTISNTRHVYLRCKHSIIAPSNLSLINGGNITVDQTGLSSINAAYWMAYYNCSFMFVGTSSETEYTLLIPKDENGNVLHNPTADDYKNEFIKRATDVGLEIPMISNIYLGHWIFSNDGKVSNENIYNNSEIYKWELANSIRVGYDNARHTQLPIVLKPNIPSSFSSFNPKSGGIVFNDGYISFDKEIKISERKEFFITSNVIPLYGKKEINSIVTPNNLDYRTGVLMDSMSNIDFDNPIYATSNSIKEGERYLVRSIDEEFASITYNGNTYSTSLAQTRANLVVGSSAAGSFSVLSGNPVLYRISNPLQFQSMKLRIVNKIPEKRIKQNESLDNNYWYLVEHDKDSNNTTDHITYNNIKYYVGSSFLCQDGITSFTSSGGIHLRRCWNQDYDKPSDEKLDASFWEYDQKPKWCNVELGVMECLLENNSLAAKEMEKDNTSDNFEYISSGHQMFNKLANSLSGIPSYTPVKIRGAYLQIKLEFSTLNIM